MIQVSNQEHSEMSFIQALSKKTKKTITTSKWSEVKWSEVKRSEVKWSEVKWSEVKWSEVKWSEVKWLGGVFSYLDKFKHWVGNGLYRNHVCLFSVTKINGVSSSSVRGLKCSNWSRLHLGNTWLKKLQAHFSSENYFKWLLRPVLEFKTISTQERVWKDSEEVDIEEY